MFRYFVVLALALLTLVPDSHAGLRRRRNCPPADCCMPQNAVAPNQPLVGMPYVPPPNAAPVATLSSPKGRAYQIFTTAEQPRPTSEVERAEARTDSQQFRGHVRRVAKTSIAPGNVEILPSVSALVQTLPPDSRMRTLGISLDESSDRTNEERRNVQVVAFIHAASSEDDNDFHLIIGDSGMPPTLLTAEISGLPVVGQASYASLKSARDQFKTFMQNHVEMHGRDTFVRFNPPIPVRVTGSLFYDVAHAPGTVGPMGLRPQTAWEIHPITQIDFEP